MTERKRKDSHALGRVTRDLSSPRGPDVTHRVDVPRDWLSDGASISVELPRNLCCAICEGGGCDACERAGAVSIRARGEPADAICVALPRTEMQQPGVRVRIPEQGGSSPREGEGRGHLLLTVRVADEASQGVERVAEEQQDEATESDIWPLTMARNIAIAVVVLLLVTWLLALAGWL